MRRSVTASLISAALAAAAFAAYKLINEDDRKSKEKEDTENEDEEVNFIHIQSDDEPEEAAEKEETAEKPAEAAAEEKSEAAEENPAIAEIADLYPYLSREFIAVQYGRNPVFEQEYPENTLVTMNHKAKFETPEVLKEFTEIAEQNGYAVENLSETSCIASRKMFTQAGSILSDIFNMANQVNALGGTYGGYRID